MAQSVRWPLVRTSAGGVALTRTPEESTRQVIVISLLPGKSAHPWQLKNRMGMPGADYDIAGASLTGDTADFIQERFRSLERAHRAKLDGQPRVLDVSNGQRKIGINYFDLEVQASGSVEASDA